MTTIAHGGRPECPATWTTLVTVWCTMTVRVTGLGAGGCGGVVLGPFRPEDEDRADAETGGEDGWLAHHTSSSASRDRTSA